MTKLDNIRSSSSKRFDDLRQAHERRLADDLNFDPAALPPPDLAGLPSVEARLEAYDDWMEKRLSRWRGEGAPAAQPDRAAGPVMAQAGQARVPASRDSASASASTPARPVEKNSGVNILAQLDRSMVDNFELQRFSGVPWFDRRARFCQTEKEFVKLALAGLDLSLRERQDLQDRPPLAAFQAKAVYVPGAGCLLNGSQFNGFRLRGSDDFEADMDVLQSVTQEKWGWGFLEEYTRVGKSMQEAGLNQAQAGRKLGINLARWQPHAERLKVLDRGMGMAAQGWQEWLWDYLQVKQALLLREIARPGPQSGAVGRRLNSRQLAELLGKFINISPLIDIGILGVRIFDIGDLLTYLISRWKAVPNAANRALLFLEKQLIEKDSAALATVRSLLGWYVFSMLEANLGSYCVPYAMAIVFNLDPELFTCPPAQIEASMAQDPRANANARLVMLSWLDAGVKYNPHALHLAAMDAYGLESPDEFFRHP